MEHEVKDVVKVLKDNKAYKKILKEILDKYKKLGKLSGIIVLENLSEEEGLILAPLDYKFYSEKRGKLSVKKFVQHFSKGKFENIDFTEVLKEYFKDDLITNKEFKDYKQKSREEYFQNILQQFEESKAYKWLINVLGQKKYGYNIIIKKYEEDRSDLNEVLINIKNAAECLSFSKKSLIPLALFSSKVTKNSHYFDIDKTEGKLLIHCICCLIEESFPTNAEETNEVLYKSGIVRDEVSNSTITFGLRAYVKEQEHMGLKCFLEQKESLQLSIRNFSRLDRIVAKNNKVFVFENPTVFTAVMENTLELTPSLICTSGQLNISSLMLLDKLVDEGTLVYYSGDFDPEGLQIADKLKVRYKDKLILWRFCTEDYISIRGSVSIKDRESKLLKLQSEELFSLRDLMLHQKTAGYQELLIDKYVEDVIASF